MRKERRGQEERDRKGGRTGRKKREKTGNEGAREGGEKKEEERGEEEGRVLLQKPLHSTPELLGTNCTFKVIFLEGIKSQKQKLKTS